MIYVYAIGGIILMFALVAFVIAKLADWAMHNEQDYWGKQFINGIRTNSVNIDPVMYKYTTSLDTYNRFGEQVYFLWIPYGEIKLGLLYNFDTKELVSNLQVRASVNDADESVGVVQEDAILEEINKHYDLLWSVVCLQN